MKGWKESPVVEYYTVSIGVFVFNPICAKSRLDIKSAQKYFTSYINAASTYDQKCSLERACALLQWAENCKGDLYDYYSSIDRIVFKFGFEDLGMMKQFVDNIKTIIPDLTKGE